MNRKIRSILLKTTREGNQTRLHWRCTFHFPEGFSTLNFHKDSLKRNSVTLGFLFIDTGSKQAFMCFMMCRSLIQFFSTMLSQRWWVLLAQFLFPRGAQPSSGKIKDFNHNFWIRFLCYCSFVHVAIDIFLSIYEEIGAAYHDSSSLPVAQAPTLLWPADGPKLLRDYIAHLLCVNASFFSLICSYFFTNLHSYLKCNFSWI